MRTIFIPLLITLLLCALLVAPGCLVGTMYRPEYEVALTNVSRTPPPSSVPAALPHPDGNARFVDDWLAFEWVVTRKSLDVKIHSEAAEMLSIAWDRAKFVSIEGTEHRLVDRHVKHKDRGFPKLPTALKPGVDSLQSLYPVDYLGWEREKIIDWRCRSLLPEMAGLASVKPEPVQQFGRDQLGKSVSIVVPVRGPSGSREYRFTFTVIGFTVRRIIAG